MLGMLRPKLLLLLLRVYWAELFSSEGSERGQRALFGKKTGNKCRFLDRSELDSFLPIFGKLNPKNPSSIGLYILDLPDS